MAGTMVHRHNWARLAWLAVHEAGSGVLPRRLFALRPRAPLLEGLVTVPRLLTNGDADKGAALYAGVFDLAGTPVETDGRPVFSLVPPSHDWADALHSFSWLADLVAADNALTRAYARSLIEEWLAHGRKSRAANHSGVAARRLLNWMAFAPHILADAEGGFSRRFLRAMAQQAERLRFDIRLMRFGMARLETAIALAHSGLSLPEGKQRLSLAERYLTDDLKRMVLPDGGPATRNPQDLLHLGSRLLALAAGFEEHGSALPACITSALDRLMPMLRALSHEDGSLALFNGAGAVQHDLLERILALDPTEAKPVLNGSFSGYQRLEGGRSVVIADTGAPPPLDLSAHAHAGTLSFEFSTAGYRLIVNCGAPPPGSAALREAARKSAAHSTLVLNGQSSSRFISSKLLSPLVGPLLREGPQIVPVSREQDAQSTGFTASHDGYKARLSMVHGRTLRLANDGTRLDGTDTITPTKAGASADILLAFHLHPSVRASLIEDGQAVLLTLPNEELWVFAADGYTAELEESVFFASESAPKPSLQIVVRPGRKSGARLDWLLARTSRREKAGTETLS